MPGPSNLASAWAPRLLSVLRVIAALLFLEHGLQKLAGFPAPLPLPAGETVRAFSLLWFAGVIEVVGGVLLTLGLFTRPVAFVLSGEMAVAYFMAHAPRGFFPALNGGEAAVLYCFTFLYLAAAGGGAWSVDAMRTKRQ
jgi:putative oxidoreductase